MKKRGKFIVIDGGEGCGKTSVLKEIAVKFGEELVLTHETGGTPFAEAVREIIHNKDFKDAPPESFFGLVWAARADHIRSKIEPALSRGKNVITDRFDSSTYAYQIYGQEGSNLEDLFWKTREIFLGATKPDLYVFFDVAPETALKRIEGRDAERTHFDDRELNFHKRVRSGFNAFLKYVPHKVIDASQPFDKVVSDFEVVIRGEIGR